MTSDAPRINSYDFMAVILCAGFVYFLGPSYTCYTAITLIAISRIAIKFFMVTEETILVIRDVGIQVKTVYLGGRSVSRFIDRSKIQDIIINEAITMMHIRVYMAIIVEGQDKMVVVFQFLCKTRYRNTLPLPPFAPKLLALPSSSDRYIKYQSTGLTETTANELILDNQWAMPIDLIEMHENYFGEGRQSNRRGLDQTDEHLLSVPLRAGAPGVNGTTAGTTGMLSRSRTPAVSWLRRTEYISSETPTGAGKGAGKDSGARRRNMAVDNTREGQIAAIEKTFERFLKKSDKGSSPVSEDDFLSSLKHPTKPDLKAIESIPVYPDFSIWGNSYTLVTFDVDPEMSNDQRVQSLEQGTSRQPTAQRSSNALIKPMHDANDPETWLGYYLPDMETAKEINKKKRSRAANASAGLGLDDDEEDAKEMSFIHQRDYTYSTMPCAALSQLVFTFRDVPESKQKAAFYNNMQSKLMLRKKRVKRYEDDDPQITHIDVTPRRMNSDELAAKRDSQEAIGL
ncbi:RNA polymerase-associated factor [Mortierella antarctica]|nr:RNA polymerase-associated factor [Mortierella antarctica]